MEVRTSSLEAEIKDAKNESKVFKRLAGGMAVVTLAFAVTDIYDKHTPPTIHSRDLNGDGTPELIVTDDSKQRIYVKQDSTYQPLHDLTQELAEAYRDSLRNSYEATQ